jgi:hypothetical protein
MTNRAARSDVEVVAETTKALEDFANRLLAAVREMLRALATKPPREYLWLVADDDEPGVLPIRYVLWRPGFVGGIALTANEAVAADVEVDILASLDGGATRTSIFDAATRPTIAAGAMAGGGVVNLVGGAAVGGVAGTLTTYALPKGTILYCELITGGAVGLNVQLLTEQRVDLGRVHIGGVGNGGEMGS